MKKMSKILSIILAISMVISMIPMTFAAEGDTDAPDAGVTVVYPLIQRPYEAYKSSIPGKETSVLFPCEITYSHSGGRLQWHSTTSTFTPQPSWGRGSVGVHFSSVKSTVEDEEVYNPSDEYAAWTIRVPKSGKYNISTIYGTASNGTGGAMYILPGDTLNIADAVKAMAPVITIDCYSATVNTSYDDFNKYNNPNAGSGNAKNVKVSDIAIRELTAGEYIVVWMGYGNKVSTVEGTLGRYVLRPASITLDGNDTNRALIYADLTGTKTELDAAIDEETGVVLNSVYMSDGVAATVAEKEEITYSSSNEEVATVTGSTIKAVSAGNATIYAKSGDYVLGEIDITVNDTAEAGVKVVYPMVQFIYRAKGETTVPGEITYDNIYSAQRLAWHTYITTVGGVKNTGWSDNSLSLTFMNDQEYAAYKIKVPKKGKYNISLMHGTTPAGSVGEMYILPSNYTSEQILSAFKTQNAVLTVDFGKPIDPNDPNTSGDPTGAGYTQFWAYYGGGSLDLSKYVPTPFAEGKVVLDAGEYLVVWRGVGTKTGTNGTRYVLLPATMILDGGDGLAVMDAAFADHDETLSVDETTTVTATGTLSNTGLQRNVGGAAKFTYASSNPEVATVDSSTGVVTAVSGGVAKITATCAEAIDGYNSISTLIAVDEPTTSVSFGADASVDGIEIKTNVSGYVQGTVGSVGINTPVEVKAEPTVKVDDKTYVFRGWVRGNAAGGRVISLDPKYDFTAMTNTYLTAIYTEAANEEYYAWNGEFLGTTKPSAPEVVGYSFSEWKESPVNSVKRFVAQYTQLSATYGVTYNGDTKQYKYDDPVTLSSDTNVYWYRDGKPVDYGTEYTFNVWDKTEVTTSNEGHDLPKIVLDVKAKDDNYMVEYDANRKTIIEVGILFNAEGDNAPTVASCKEKMNSQRDLSVVEHGQFAAKAGTYTQARGYLIYQDGKSYKVIYSE